MEITLIKQLNNTFKVAYPSDYENIKKIKTGRELHCVIKRPRNYKFHKKFFALINLVYENQALYTNIDDLRYDLVIESGYFERRLNLEGDEVKKPKSISFSKMTEAEFSDLYEAVLNTICRCFKFQKKEIENNILEFA